MADTRLLCAMSGFHPDELAHWSDVLATGSGYRRVTIPQKRRRPRIVFMPSVGLDRMLKQLRLGIWRCANYVPPREVHGFISGRDIATNAAQHLDQDVVLKVDISDFFGTIQREKLLPALLSSGFDEECTEKICGVSLINGSLAQGFSTGPLLSNMAFLETDIHLAAVAEQNDVTYTRYVDDLVFSGGTSMINDHFLSNLDAALAQFGWSLNPRKTRFMRRGKAQYVTGLYVGDGAGPHIPRSMKRLLRRELYFASTYGSEDARRHSPTPITHERLGGWVHYAAHVDPVVGEQFRSVWKRVSSGRSNLGTPDSWDQLLDEIEFPDHW
jgi:RNA-directed DNA polymerase